MLAGLISLPASAEFEGSWFQVEVLIFENTGNRSEKPERWPTYPDLERLSSALTITELDPEVAQADETAQQRANSLPIPFSPLSEAEWTLSQEKTALERSRNYRVLYHQSWMQPVPGRNRVVPIRIDAGELYGSQHELQGYIELSVERFLHLTTNLQLIRYAQTDNPFRLIDDSDDAQSTNATNATRTFNGLSLDQEASALGSNVFDTDIITSNNNQYYVATESIQMKQRRRMRSAELHYIDNPEFGLLIHILPVEIGGQSDDSSKESAEAS
jgi:hypothetical protein